MVPVFNDFKTVVISYPLSWVITALFFIIYFKYYLQKNQASSIQTVETNV